MQLHDTTLQQAATSVFARMPIMIDAINIMNRIEREIKDCTDLTSLSIRVAIKDQVPYIKIIQQLQEQVDAGISRVLGDEITKELINFKA